MNFRLRPQQGLLGLAIALTLIQLQLVWNKGVIGDGESYFLGYAAVWYLLWRRGNPLRLNSTRISRATGILLIAGVLLGSFGLQGQSFYLQLAPFASGLGVALLGWQFSELRQYWRELLVLGSLAFPTGVLRDGFDLSLVTATAVANVVWYSGLSVVQDGVFLITPSGTLEVNQGCSGVLLIVRLLNLGFLFAMLFPLRWIQVGILAIAAVAVGFGVNLLRVSILIWLFALSHHDAFQNWHVGRESQLFSLFAMLIFGGVCYSLLEWSDRATD